MVAIRAVITRLVQVGGSVVGVHGSIEEPLHTVEQVGGGVEIRRYGPRIAAQTTITGSEETARRAGFRRLAGYIFGANHTATTIAMTAPVAAQQAGGAHGAKIAMTAPVSQHARADGAWVVRFFMPADKTMASLPEPDDPKVKLVVVAAETPAVRRFRGDRSPSAVTAQTAELLRRLPDIGFEPEGIPQAWFYDPPWTIPVRRRNEIAVPVKPIH